MTWFEDLTGCKEESPDRVREHLKINGNRLVSSRDGRSWIYGALETPNLADLRQRAGIAVVDRRAIRVREIVANVQHLHRDEANAFALFQVASQFNLLEMTSSSVTPEGGVGIYEDDFTQGPACAIAAGAGTIYRNYFAPVGGQIGQSAAHQIDCLSDLGDLLGNSGQRLWKMVNGYALPDLSGLKEIHRILKSLKEQELDRLRQSLRIGIQWKTQVTLEGATHLVSQAYCSAMPVRYTEHSEELWRPAASLILESAYEATLCAAIINFRENGSRKLFLTLLGGGAFGNASDWIFAALRRSLELYRESGLDIAVVSYGRSNSHVSQLAAEFGG